MNTIRLNTIGTPCKAGGNSGGGGAEDKIGMIYVHKKDIMAVFEFPSDGTVPNDELLVFMLQLSILPIVAFKGTPFNADKVISYSSAMSEEIAESRFTYDAWSYTALDYDRLTFGISDRGELPAWNLISGNFADAKATIDAMFPTRITKEEFYNLNA